MLALEAEGRPKQQLALFRTAALDLNLQELSAALDPVVLSELRTVGSIEITARPSLDLPAMQLAIDCEGEVAECMAAVVREAGVEGLVAPILRRDGDQVLVTLLYYSAEDNRIQDVTRTLTGRSVAQAMLDAVPAMVREIFKSPSETPPAETPEALAQSERTEARSANAPSKFLRILPWALGGAGVAVLGVGIGLGASSQSLESDYKKAPTESRGDVNRALDTLDKAERRALSANVLFGVGSALVASGIVTFFLVRKKVDAQHLTVSPQLSVSHAGVSVSGVFQ